MAADTATAVGVGSIGFVVQIDEGVVAVDEVDVQSRNAAVAPGGY